MCSVEHITLLLNCSRITTSQFFEQKDTNCGRAIQGVDPHKVSGLW